MRLLQSSISAWQGVFVTNLNFYSTRCVHSQDHMTIRVLCRKQKSEFNQSFKPLHRTNKFICNSRTIVSSLLRRTKLSTKKAASNSYTVSKQNQKTTTGTQSTESGSTLLWQTSLTQANRKSTRLLQQHPWNVNQITQLACLRMINWCLLHWRTSIRSGPHSTTLMKQSRETRFKLVSRSRLSKRQRMN